MVTLMFIPCHKAIIIVEICTILLNQRDLLQLGLIKLCSSHCSF